VLLWGVSDRYGVGHKYSDLYIVEVHNFSAAINYCQNLRPNVEHLDESTEWLVWAPDPNLSPEGSIGKLEAQIVWLQRQLHDAELHLTSLADDGHDRARKYFAKWYPKPEDQNQN
jgi:hypothetical protein